MELFLLLSALICGLTGTVRTAVVRAPEIVASHQLVAQATPVTAAARALALVRVRPAPSYPVATPAAEIVSPRLLPLARTGARLTPERRRE
jgi:hypothetical protein